MNFEDEKACIYIRRVTDVQAQVSRRLWHMSYALPCMINVKLQGAPCEEDRRASPMSQWSATVVIFIRPDTSLVRLGTILPLAICKRCIPKRLQFGTALNDLVHVISYMKCERGGPYDHNANW